MEFADEIFEDGVDELVHNKVIDAPTTKKKAGRTKNGRSEKPARQRGACCRRFTVRRFFIGAILTFFPPSPWADRRTPSLLKEWRFKPPSILCITTTFRRFRSAKRGPNGQSRAKRNHHGALVEKALTPVLPPKSDFPYTIRVVSEAILPTAPLLKAQFALQRSL